MSDGFVVEQAVYNTSFEGDYLKIKEILNNLPEFKSNKNLLISNMKNIQDEESKPIRDAKKYIHDNFNKHISLENVSEYIGFNAAYFSTLFKKETGKNFLEYVTELRIQNAKNYLIQTNYDIAEVASAVGYNDLKYFSKLFKKTTGLNPSEFRKLYS